MDERKNLLPMITIDKVTISALGIELHQTRIVILRYSNMRVILIPEKAFVLGYGQGIHVQNKRFRTFTQEKGWEKGEIIQVEQVVRQQRFFYL